MIILDEVAKKLQDILNGVDSETSTTLTNPLSGTYYFVVNTVGFHIDSLVEKDRNKNFIPVFIDTMGGQFNPVKGIEQGTFSYPIAIYYPVRFKNDFYALGDFLVKAFVGSKLNYGTVSGSAISNISGLSSGEIQNLDFKQFKDWTQTNFKLPIEKMEPYMSMECTLYLTTAKAGLLFGNDVKLDLTFTKPNSETYTLEDIDWDGGSLQSNTQATSEQEEGTNESTSIPLGNAMSTSFKIYPNFDLLAKNETTKYFYRELLSAWLSGDSQALDIDLTINIGPAELGLTYTRKCFIQSNMVPFEKGQLVALTLTFAKKTQIS